MNTKTIRNVILVVIVIWGIYLYMDHQSKVTCESVGITDQHSKECNDYLDSFPQREPGR